MPAIAVNKKTLSRRLKGYLNYIENIALKFKLLDLACKLCEVKYVSLDWGLKRCSSFISDQEIDFVIWAIYAKIIPFQFIVAVRLYDDVEL